MAEINITLPPKQELKIVSDGSFNAYVGSGGIGMFVGPKHAAARQLTIRAAREEREVTIRHAPDTNVAYESHHVNITEDLNDMPVETPAKHRGSRSLQEQIRELLQRELHTRAKDDGYETMAEAEDFKLDPTDVDDMLTPYEFKPMVDDPVQTPPPETPQAPPADPEPPKAPDLPPAEQQPQNG